MDPRIKFLNVKTGEWMNEPPDTPLQRRKPLEMPPILVVGRRPPKGPSAKSASSNHPAQSIPSFTNGTWDTLIVAKKPMPGICTVEGMGHEKRTHVSESPGVHGARVTQTGQKGKKINVATRIWTSTQYMDLVRMLKVLFPTRKQATDYVKVLKSDDRWGRYYQAYDYFINVPNLPINIISDTGLLVDFDTLVNDSPVRTYNEARAARGEGLYVPIVQTELVDSPLMSLEEAKARTEAEQAMLDAQLLKPLDVEHPALRMFGISALHFLKASLLQPSSTPGVFEMKFECMEHVPINSAKAAVGTAKGATSGWDKIVNAIDPGSPSTLGGKP